MPIRQIIGGQKLRAHLRGLEKEGRKPTMTVDVGFFSTSRYPDGTPVAMVAAWNEFGTVNIPERPFFRNMIQSTDDELVGIIIKAIDPVSLQFERRIGDVIGAFAAGKLQQSITQLRDPPNAPGTIDSKGSSNPLIDTGFMRLSVAWRVNTDRK